MTDQTAEDQTVEIAILGGIDELSETEWDGCANPNGGVPPDPFTTHRFLKALEDSGSVGQGTGWAPRHLVARQDGKVIGVAPFYAKGHSQGEYIFDHAWAHAYERAGGQYYPKLLCAVPFTPASGRRLLVRPECRQTAQAALLEGMVRVTIQNGLASANINFCTKEEFDIGGKVGFLQRTSQQFHWENRGFGTFEDFLAALSSRKRKAIRRERRIAQGYGGRIVQLTGDQIEPEHWDAFWHFYQDTGSRKWGTPYLTREFFQIAQDRLRDDILLVMCERDDRWVAGAMNVLGRDVLYGRYWGCIEHHDCLHFEVCYYQAIEAAIARGLARVEAGAQGEHKLARGYLPVPTRSLHYIADEGFRGAVATYLAAERDAVGEEIEILTTYGPFRKTGKEDRE